MVAVMTPFVFDTLSASKQLREAGMSEGVAEAVVSVFQHAATMPDISHLATKADLEALSVATTADIEAIRSDMATKADLAKLKSDLDVFRAEVRAEFATVRSELSDKLRQQTWTFIGGVAVIVTIVTTAGRLFG